MITLNILGDSIANILKQPDNHELKERIKNSYKSYMAKYIRQSVEKHGIDDTMLISFEDLLIDVTYPEPQHAGSIFNNMGQPMKRSKHRIPTPIRFKNSSPYVSVTDGYNVMTYVREQEVLKHVSYLSPGRFSMYFIKHGYIYCMSRDKTVKLKSKAIVVETLFEDPETVLDFYQGESDFQDTVLPYPRDIIVDITTQLLQKEFGIIPTPDEIKVELNDESTR